MTAYERISICAAGEQRFRSEQQFFYKLGAAGLEKHNFLPSIRIYPELVANIPKIGPHIAQGQYKWGANISHFLFDVVSDFLLLRNRLDGLAIKTHISLPVGREILSLLNTQIVEGLRFSTAVIPNASHNKLAYIDNPWRFSGASHPAVANIIRETFKEYLIDPRERKSPRGLLVRRSTRLDKFPLGRNIENIYGLARKLTVRFFPFDVVELEGMSALEQIQLFNACSIIVAAHGSGLVWLNFCQRETTIVELLPPYFMHGGRPKLDFWLMSQAHDLNHLPVFCERVNGDQNHPYNIELKIEAESLSRLIEIGLNSKNTQL